MLYVTTREKYDASTTPWVLASSNGADGGLYLPFKMPRFTVDKEKSFGQTVAEVLNLFFGTKLTGWDVEFSVGRYPVKLTSVGQKQLVCECWKNLEGSYAKMERSLAARIYGCSAAEVNMTSWVQIAVRIAVLTGVFGELQRQDVTETVDVAVPVGDFRLLMAVLYCRQIGLPIGTIICGCQGNDALWELLNMGQMRTAAGVEPEMERLIQGSFGVDEVHRYLDCCTRGEVYTLLPEANRQLRSNLFAAVVSRERMMQAIPKVHGTSGYVMSLDVAVAYSSLMDYYAKTGERRMALMLSDCNPAEQADCVAAAMKITERELKELLR